MGRVKRVIADVAMAGFYLTIFLSLFTSSSLADSDQAIQKATGQVNFERLEGRWVRPDGGYVLELRNIKKDGSATASYFNPKPIKVFRAEASRKDGNIHLFIELRDTNYPGSIYNLQYDPKSDRLKGTYFQAMERLSFDVEFVRAK